ncbi:MAG: rhodanese-like domain-containing protein [Gammaproteobacteria bacterium]|nr:rhodanese-like domain-containing protein [Gammaproteobacteria bacterium]HXK56436.1 rhodanese-like domain-containing protein [Gammaproteobacteria bacterium]
MTKFIVLAFLVLPYSGACAEDNPAIEAMQEYLEFAEYSEGAISTEQLASIESEDIFFVDTRNAAQFAAGHIPGAVNIEWRQILTRRDELPTDRPVVLYCETGLLSSKAHFALKVAGRENVKVLWGGYLMWSARQSFNAAQKQNKPPDRQM